MLNTIRKSMRISHNNLDDEINNNIEICKRLLTVAGVYADDNDELFKKACELYCKAQFNYNGKGESYMSSYEKLRDAMALCGDYNVRPSY